MMMVMTVDLHHMESAFSRAPQTVVKIWFSGVPTGNGELAKSEFMSYLLCQNLAFAMEISKFNIISESYAKCNNNKTKTRIRLIFSKHILTEVHAISI
jgi:hypothetical protein